MCRYAFHSYKDHFACFTCHKVFKPLVANFQTERCPQCSGLMHAMGKDFKAPRRNDKAAWKAVKMLDAAGFHYDSCGCGGPGYRPAGPNEVGRFLSERK